MFSSSKMEQSGKAGEKISEKTIVFYTKPWGIKVDQAESQAVYHCHQDRPMRWDDTFFFWGLACHRNGGDHF